MVRVRRRWRNHARSRVCDMIPYPVIRISPGSPAPPRNLLRTFDFGTWSPSRSGPRVILAQSLVAAWCPDPLRLRGDPFLPAVR